MKRVDAPRSSSAPFGRDRADREQPRAQALWRLAGNRQAHRRAPRLGGRGPPDAPVDQAGDLGGTNSS